jgi:hypothetical protein
MKNLYVAEHGRESVSDRFEVFAFLYYVVLQIVNVTPGENFLELAVYPPADED